MANLIEFKTWPNHQHLYYEFTGSALSFWVKSRSKVTVGLAKKLSDGCSYEIEIDRHKCTMSTKNNLVVNAESSTHNIDNFLHGNRFTKFWVIWKSNTIAFGIGSTLLLLGRHCLVTRVKYVTFYASDDTRHPAEWRCYLPPVIEDLPLKQIEGAKLNWVQVKDSNSLPDGALIGGHENEFLYIIRAPFRGSLTPGKFVPSLRHGFISWGGHSHKCDTLEILCGIDCIWVPSNDDQVPGGALEAGYTEVLHETMYVGRVYHMGHLIVGKIAPSHKCCYYPFENKELFSRNFEVLVVPDPKIKVPGGHLQIEERYEDVSEANVIEFE